MLDQALNPYRSEKDLVAMTSWCAQERHADAQMLPIKNKALGRSPGGKNGQKQARVKCEKTTKTAGCTCGFMVARACPPLVLRIANVRRSVKIITSLATARDRGPHGHPAPGARGRDRRHTDSRQAATKPARKVIGTLSDRTQVVVALGRGMTPLASKERRTHAKALRGAKRQSRH